MNHQKVYDELIQKRKLQPAVGYTEKHHILPKSLGGSDDPSNLVVLTGREHWVAHLLLHKIHNCQQTAFACYMMAMRCEERGIPLIRSSRLYEHIRKEHAKYISKVNSIKQKGKGNSQYGTMWICNMDLQENKKISKNEKIPEGWEIGRSNWGKIKQFKCKSCGTIFIASRKKEYCSRKCQPTSKGLKMSEETKKKMSDIKKELYKDPTKNPAYGRSFKHTEESKKKISLSLKNNFKSV
jgi:hypothetical protein